MNTLISLGFLAFVISCSSSISPEGKFTLLVFLLKTGLSFRPELRLLFWGCNEQCSSEYPVV